jgi:hypothetical protein
MILDSRKEDCEYSFARELVIPNNVTPSQFGEEFCDSRIDFLFNSSDAISETPLSIEDWTHNVSGSELTGGHKEEPRITVYDIIGDFGLASEPILIPITSDNLAVPADDNHGRGSKGAHRSAMHKRRQHQDNSSDCRRKK